MKRAFSIAVATIVCLALLSTTAYAVSYHTNGLSTATFEETANSITEKTEIGFDVTALGADGSDTNDDTDAIQRALNQYDSVYIPDGTYYINVDRSLSTKSNQTLVMSSNAVLQALPSSNSCTSVISIENDNNVTVTGGQIKGERNTHRGTSGEWGMGICILSSNDVTISGVTASDCWGDGFYIGSTGSGAGSVASCNVSLDNVIGDNNRRQGLSITNATQVTVTNSIFRNTNGTPPQAGIDIEPNDDESTSDISIINTQCYGNAGSGLELMGYFEKIQGITVTNSVFKDNALFGIRIDNADDLKFNDTISADNRYYGIYISRDTANATFTNMTISGNQDRGVSLVTDEQREGTENILFKDSVFKNNSQNQANGVDGVRIDNMDASGYIKNVTFSSCNFMDDQPAKTQRFGLTVGYSNGMSGITVDDCAFTGNISGSYMGGESLNIQ